MGRVAGYVLLVVAVGAALLVGLARNPAHEERDVVQERLEHATLPLTGASSVGQTFLARHDGLKAVEFLVALYNAEAEMPASARLTFTLHPLDAPDVTPVQVEVMAAGLEHNQKLRFGFDPLPHSGGVTYVATLRSDADHGIGFWYCESEAYAYGARQENGADQAGDLHMVTYYDYAIAAVASDALRLMGERARQVPALLFLLLLPGLVFWVWARPDEALDPASALAWMMALSLATWPLLLLWSTTLGLHLTGPACGGIVLGLLLLGALGVRRRGGLGWHRAASDSHLPELALFAILGLGWATRLLQVRDLAVPAWVDSVHHTLITQLIAETGQVPDSLRPYLPIDGFHYHFGFHAVAAVFQLLGGLTSDQAVLLLGQVLNAAAGLSAYALAVRWARDRWAGVGAALVVTLLSYMPAYYVSWGRYTQLAGLILLPFAAMASARWVSASRMSPGLLATAAWLVAGLGLTHYRVSVFYVLYALPLVVWFLLRHGVARPAWVRFLWAGGALILAVALAVSPWMARFAARVVPQIGETYGGMAAGEGTDTSFSTSLLRVGWTPWLLYLAGAGLIWALLRRRVEMVLLGVWVGLWLLVANLRWLGWPNIWLVHNQSVVISYWLPAGVLCGWLAADMTGWLSAEGTHLWPSRWWAAARHWSLALAALVLAGIGAWQRVDAVNPVTVLAAPEDVQAIAWAAENLPEDALVLINTGKWQGELRSGSDGGWWLPILAHRQVTLPCVLYAQGPHAYYEQVNALARMVEEAPSVDDPALIAALQQAGVTHVFVGLRGGKLMPQALDASPHYAPLYILGPSRLYAFEPEPAAR